MRSIPSGLQSKLARNMQTAYNNADPRMTVAIARARTAVVDATYWTVETIREGANLGAVAVAPRRFRPSGTPNRLYEIHVQDGVVGTALREYPDRLRDGWQNQFELGEGTDVAIAFDGYWERFRERWRLITEEKPYIFWVDNDNVLWRQHWDDASTRGVLDTGVEYVRAMRGWKNTKVAERDQGIVVAYIKTDGTVWYRNYCQQADYTYQWEASRAVTVFGATAKSLNLFMTVDYRMGFVISDTDDNVHWLVTTRNWSGMASPDEVVLSRIKAVVDVMKVTQKEGTTEENIHAGVSMSFGVIYGASENRIMVAENTKVMVTDETTGEVHEEWGTTIQVTFQHGVTEIQASDLHLADSNGIRFPVNDVTHVSDNTFLIKTNDFNNARGDLTLRTVEEANVLGEAGQLTDAMDITFLPVNLEPDETPVPTVEGIWND